MLCGLAAKDLLVFRMLVSRNDSQGLRPAGGDVLASLLNHHIKATRAQVIFDLPVPLFGLVLRKPGREARKLVWTKVCNGDFEVFNGHTQIIALGLTASATRVNPRR